MNILSHWVVKSPVLLLLLLTCCHSGGNTIKPQVKPLIEAVYASGNVVSRNEYQLFAQAEGYVLEKVVADGARVKKGDPLYILESGQQTSRFRLAQQSYNIAAANFDDNSPVLREARTAIEASKTRLEFDSINFRRFENLYKQNATPQLEYDRAKVQFQNSRNEYELQKSRYAKVRNQLLLELENARSQLAIAANESGKYVLRSEADGKVFRTLKEKGELVRRSEAIAIIGDDKTFYLSLAVDELDIVRVKSGQEVIAVIDAFGDRTFKGQVETIYPFVNRQQQAVRVDVTLSDSLPGYYSGLAVEANIIIRKADSALVIPKTALIDGEFVLVKNGSDKERRKVAIGISTFDEVEISGGLTDQTEVFMPE